MRCPCCGQDKTGVKETRPRQHGYVTRRRRYCPKCGYTWSTIEQCEETIKTNLETLAATAEILLGRNTENGDGHGSSARQDA